jgi:3-deoxy-D-manno-octulosonic-acid transferase
VSLAWWSYRAAATGLGAVAPWARWLASPRERELWSERMGEVAASAGCDAWVHSASLGEAVAVGPLVRELQTLGPRARLVLTATTRAGRTRLMSLGYPTTLAPIDSPQAVGRFTARVRPCRLFLVETELWPHWLLRARSLDLPVAIVSARLSARSVEGYRRLGSDLTRLVGGLAAVLCQTDEDESRWRSVGARPERTAVVGNLKYDALPDAVPDRAAARGRLGLDRTRPTLVLGSLRPGEARVVARAWRGLPETLRQEWQVVAVPRHARAAGELRTEAEHEGTRRATDAPPSGDAWRWDERPGVLVDYYGAADVAIVCGSLLPYSGHNPMEAAACGAAVIVGPHHANQMDAVERLRRRQAIDVATGSDELRTAMLALMSNPSERDARSERGLAVVREARGGARRAVAWLAAHRLWPPA